MGRGVKGHREKLLASLSYEVHKGHKVGAYRKFEEFHPTVDGHILRDAHPSERLAVSAAKQWVDSHYESGKTMSGSDYPKEFDVHSTDPARLGGKKMDRINLINRSVEKHMKRLAKDKDEHDKAKIEVEDFADKKYDYRGWEIDIIKASNGKFVAHINGDPVGSEHESAADAKSAAERFVDRSQDKKGTKK